MLLMALLLSSCLPKDLLPVATASQAQQDQPAVTAAPTQAELVDPTLPPTLPPTLAVATAEVVPLVRQPAACTVSSPRPTPGPTEQSLFAAPGAGDWSVGPETAYVTIIEYSDFQ
jgi:hypothetical protein